MLRLAIPIALGSLLLTTVSVPASAQTRRWHDLTPDSLRGTGFSSVALAHDGAHRAIYASYGRGVLRSNDDGRTWRHVLAGEHVAHVTVPATIPSLVYALVGPPGALYKSSDGGQTWQDLYPAIQRAAPFLLPEGFSRVEISPHDTSRIALARSSGGAQLFLSRDGGRSFRYIDFGSSSDGSDLNFVPSQRTPGRLYAASFNSGASFDHRFVVIDGWGESAQIVSSYSGPVVPEGPVQLLADGNDVLYSNEWISRDEGATWEKTPENGRFDTYAVATGHDEVFGLRRRDNNYVLYDHYLSVDRGLTWAPLPNGAGVFGGTAAFDSRDSTLFSATQDGVFAYARSGTVGTPADVTPTAPMLRVRAYPNPSRGPVTVEVQGATGARLTAEVFDLMGRRVTTLAEGTPGRFVWTETSPPGLYVVRVQSDAPSGAEVSAVLRITRL